MFNVRLDIKSCTCISFIILRFYSKALSYPLPKKSNQKVFTRDASIKMSVIGLTSFPVVSLVMRRLCYDI